MGDKAKNWIIAFVLLNLALFGAVLYYQRSQRPGGQSVGGKAPAFTLPQLGSPKKVSLQDYRGEVVLLDFWATWCKPCRKQMPAMQKLADDEALADKLAILSINTDQGPDQADRAESFVEQYDYTFTTLIDDGSASARYGVARIPTLVVVTPGGEIHHKASGVHSEQELRELVQAAAK